jgi:hypothetical protein
MATVRGSREIDARVRVAALAGSAITIALSAPAVASAEQAMPISERTGNLPGAVEPQPVNQQQMEEFWAHPPWKKGVAAAHELTPSAGGIAVTLTCEGGGTCSGSLKLGARLRVRRVRMRAGKRVAGSVVREVVLGTASFSFSYGAPTKVSFVLTHRGKALVAQLSERAHPVRVRLSGSGVAAATFALALA